MNAQCLAPWSIWCCKNAISNRGSLELALLCSLMGTDYLRAPGEVTLCKPGLCSQNWKAALGEAPGRVGECLLLPSHCQSSRSFLSGRRKAQQEYGETARQSCGPESWNWPRGRGSMRPPASAEAPRERRCSFLRCRAGRRAEVKETAWFSAGEQENEMGPLLSCGPRPLRLIGDVLPAQTGKCGSGACRELSKLRMALAGRQQR